MFISWSSFDCIFLEITSGCITNKRLIWRTKDIVAFIILNFYVAYIETDFMAAKVLHAVRSFLMLLDLRFHASNSSKLSRCICFRLFVWRSWKFLIKCWRHFLEFSNCKSRMSNSELRTGVFSLVVGKNSCRSVPGNHTYFLLSSFVFILITKFLVPCLPYIDWPLKFSLTHLFLV